MRPHLEVGERRDLWWQVEEFVVFERQGLEASHCADTDGQLVVQVPGQVHVVQVLQALRA